MSKENKTSWFKRKCKVLFKDGRLLWLFLGGLLVAFCAQKLIILLVTWHAFTNPLFAAQPAIFAQLFFLKIDSTTLTASILQIGAFIIFVFRVDELHKYYALKNNDDSRGLFGSIKKWLRDLFWYTPEVSILNPDSIEQRDQMFFDDFINVDKGKLTCEQRIKHLEKGLKAVSVDLHETKKKFNEDLRSSERNTSKKIGELESKHRDAETETSELHLSNLGREFVAIFWLIVAAAIN